MRAAVSAGVLLGCLGCTAQSPLLNVEVTGAPAGIVTLQVVATVPGRHFPPSTPIPHTGRFLVDLPPETRGWVQLAIDGRRDDGCALARGLGGTEVTGPQPHDLTIPLAPIPPACRLRVDLLGGGQGVALSQPPGIECGSPGGSCEADLPPDIAVELSLRPGRGSNFLGWSGACQGAESCRVIGQNRPTNETGRVVAHVVPARSCTKDRWCFELPLAPSQEYLALWGSSPDDIWAVGTAGTITRWNGAGWASLVNPTSESLLSVWGRGPGDVWITGAKGTLLHWDGEALRALPGAPWRDLHAVFGTADGAVRIVGDGGTLLRVSGLDLLIEESGTTQPLYALWGSSESDAWAAGGAGVLLRRTEGRWARVGTPTDASLRALWGSGPADLFVVGDRGTVLRWDGARVVQLASPTASDLHGVFGSRRNDFWAVGEHGALLHFDGARWQRPTSRLSFRANGVWASAPDNVWFAGSLGTLLRWDGELSSGGQAERPNLRALWAAGPDDVWAAGLDGAMLHFDGARWQPRQTASTSPARGVWGSGPDDVWALLQSGEIERWNGQAFTSLPDVVSAASVGNGIWGSGPGDVWVTDHKQIYHLGDAPAVYDRPVIDSFWGTGKGDVWAVGERIHHWDGAWTLRPEVPGTRLVRVWGSAKNDFWAVGHQSLLMHWDGASWSNDQLPGLNLPSSLISVSGSGADDVWITAIEGHVYRRRNGSWQSVPLEAEERNLYTAWRRGPGEVWLAGDEGILHGENDVWETQLTFPDNWLTAVSGRAIDDAWAVGGRGTMLHWDGVRWAPSRSGHKELLRGVWHAPGGVAWAVGDGGVVLRLSGHSTQTQVVPTTADLRAVHGCSDNEIWVAGTRGTLLHFDGTVWSAQVAGVDHLNAVFCNGQTVWAAGDQGALLHSQGGAWQRTPSNTSADLAALWGDGAGDLWVVGRRGTILHVDGTGVTLVPSGSTSWLRAVWSAGPGLPIWAAGDKGILLRYQNGRWVRQQGGVRNGLFGLWGSGPDDVRAVGEYGVILRRQPL